MKHFLFILAAICVAFFAEAQAEKSIWEIPKCATPNESFEQLRWTPTLERSGADTVLYVPMTIHNLANEGNAPFYNISKILDALEELNGDYAPSKIHFYMEGPILQHRNTLWNNHDSILQGARMMFKYNVPNTMNIYFVSKAAGACGYNLPYAGVALFKSCIGIGKTTWTHELGHALRLPHTFLGWEDKVQDPAKPAPKTVTYNYTLFKDSLITNRTIIDTALVELVDGSNCAIAADQICDTKPDYISYRWSCDANKMATIIHKDPNGVTFRSDATPYMSYSSDECQTRFTPLEIAKMRNVLKTTKKNLLYNQTPKAKLSELATLLIAPANNLILAPNAITFEWEKVQFAENYILQVSRSSSFSFIEVEEVLSATTKTLDLESERTYYWRVRPFNSHYANTPWATKNTFKTSSLSNVQSLAAIESMSISPNPLTNNDLLQLNIKSAESFDVNITLINMAGQVLLKQKNTLQSGENSITLTPNSLAKGMYIVEVSNEKGKNISKVIYF